MSAIMKAVLKVCDIDGQGKDESRQDFLKRCVKSINKLEDKDYDKLDQDTIAWFNNCVDVIDANKKKDKADPLPDFPDMPEEEEDKPRRRRGAADDEDKPAAKAPGVGDQVILVTKRGKEQKGKIVEMDDKLIVLAQGTEEVEFDMDRVGSIEHDPEFAAKAADDGGSKKDDEPAVPKKGDTVKLKTKRGREVEGEVVEISADEIVLKLADGEEEFNRERLESIAVVGGGRRRAGSAKDNAEAGKGKDDEKPARASSRANGGVSVGMRIKQLIVADLKASKEDIGKALTKEGLEYRPNTLDLSYAECHKLIDLMKEAKLLKA